MRRPVAPIAVILAALALPARADAHRLDELLQATRIGINVNTVDLEIDLSPGVDVAGDVIAAIDADGDAAISDTEADAYADSVLRLLDLSIDGRGIALRLLRRRFPAIEEIREGIGTIRLVARADVAAATGRRHLTYANRFAPVPSAYLVNALTPSEARVRLDEQKRDPRQRLFTIDFDVAGSRAWIGWSSAAFALIAILIVGRRTSSGVRTSAHTLGDVAAH